MKTALVWRDFPLSDWQSGDVHNEYWACPSMTKSVTGKANEKVLASNSKVGSVRFHFSANEAKFRWAEATAAMEARRVAVYFMLVRF